MPNGRLLLPTACIVSIGVLAPTASGQEATSGSRPAAIVNGEPIPIQEVDAILKVRPTKVGRPSEAELDDMRRQALDMLVDDVLLKQFLRKHAAPVRPGEVSKKMSELQSSLKAQGQTLEAYCREACQTEAQLKSTIVTMLQRNSFIAQHLTAESVRRYYDENREFFDQVTVRASHILIRTASGTTPTQAAVAKAKLTSIREQIVAGKIDFAAAAKKYSQCPSAPTGGDIGYFPRKGTVEEPFARAAFALKKGEVSDVVQTSYGFHLIQITDRKSGTPSEFAKIESLVRDLAGEEMMMSILMHERDQARIEIKLAEHEEPAKSAPRRGFFSFGNH
jgi:peptidyl-prolyl cis-trans isomerase C